MIPNREQREVVERLQEQSSLKSPGSCLVEPDRDDLMRVQLDEDGSSRYVLGSAAVCCETGTIIANAAE